MKKRTLFICVLIFAGIPALSAQSHIIDSLKQALKTEKEDTVKVNTLNRLSDKFFRIGLYDTSEAYANGAKT